MNARITVVAGLVSAVLLAACSSDSDTSVEPLGDRKLRTLGSGDAFLDAVREGLIAQNTASQGNPDYLSSESGDQDSAPVSGDGAASGESGGDTGGESGGEGGVDDSSSGNEVTSTNVQELGVDEQDWVKVNASGDRLYLLNSAYDYYYGPEDGFIGDTLPGEEPLAAGTTLRILQLDADAPDATGLRDLPLSLDGRYAEGFYLYEKDEQTQAIVSASGNSFWAYWSEPAMFGGRDSLITRVDVSDAANASVTATLNLDGQIVSSRRIGKYLFLASRFYPQLPDVQSYQVSADQWREAVNSASATDLLPQYSLDGGANRTALIDPGSCFVSDSASSDHYYSPDIITLSVFDLEAWQFSDNECYLGATETLYASPQAVFLATTQYDYSSGPVAENGGSLSVDDGSFPVDIEWHDPRVDTDIHQFNIDSGQLLYAGSGTVQGHLGWNPLRKPFRMSERDGYLRVATFNDRQGLDESPILLSVLHADGGGELDTVASLPNASEPGFIGKPGEQLYASRFLGDRAYLVTFRQTDPLYIIDLADPLQPAIAGELQIDGYSDYLHPISADYLLGIGKDAVATPGDIGDGRGALVQGVKLSLFNVSNPAAPTEVQSMLVGQRGTESRALSDHRAIVVQSATDDHPARVGFGIDVHGQASPSSSPTGHEATTYHGWNYSGFHGFEIRTGADAGITSRGAMVVESFGDGGDYYHSYADDRAVMVNDSVFYIRGDKVHAAPWDDLANPMPAR
ncbi:beta-propeller domain-containing protein [Granulosicoccus sp. 3-233]|uniref:beta-propeller domain-containing protein n=1 Tax=Granulosicoccus sp. 3-233 TaxID=3417969 RepID=UPI003D327BDE